LSEWARVETLEELFVELARYLLCAIDTGAAARKAGLDIGIALRDFNARLTEAASQGEYRSFLATTARTPERMARLDASTQDAGSTAV
jgi:hypothetical protein